jgi:hypothetical protein
MHALPLSLLVTCMHGGTGADPMESTEASKDPIEIALRREGDSLAWEVRNTGASPIWAWLLVPSIVDGRASFAVDTAWTAVEGDLLVLRKVDTPVPEDRDADRVRSGAVRIDAGESRGGAMRLGDPVALRQPYGRPSPATCSPRRVALEVGWIPESAAQSLQRVSADGWDFAWIASESVAGGQRTARSAAISW